MSGCTDPPDREVAEYVTNRRGSSAHLLLALGCVLGVIYLAEALQRASEKERFSTVPSLSVGRAELHAVDVRLPGAGRDREQAVHVARGIHQRHHVAQRIWDFVVEVERELHGAIDD